MSSECIECTVEKSLLLTAKTWQDRNAAKDRRTQHRKFNADAQGIVMANYEKAMRHNDKMGVCTYDIMDQKKLTCPHLPKNMGECWGVKQKITGVVWHGLGGVTTMFYRSLPSVKKSGSLSCTHWLHSMQLIYGGGTVAPLQIQQVDGGSENWNNCSWGVQAALVWDHRVAEVQTLRKGPGHTHGIGDQRFSVIASSVACKLLATLSAILPAILAAFKQHPVSGAATGCHTPQWLIAMVRRCSATTHLQP